MARDATSAGDPVTAESFFQHAEHYYRVLNANDDNGSRRNTDWARQPAVEVPAAAGAETEIVGSEPVHASAAEGEQLA